MAPAHGHLPNNNFNGNFPPQQNQQYNGFGGQGGFNNRGPPQMRPQGSYNPNYQQYNNY